MHDIHSGHVAPCRVSPGWLDSDILMPTLWYLVISKVQGVARGTGGLRTACGQQGAETRRVVVDSKAGQPATPRATVLDEVVTG